MRSRPRSLQMLLLLTLTSYAFAASNLRACPLLGQQYPSPVQLSSNSEFQAATKQIENALLSSSKTYMLNETSLSIGMFSTSEEGLLYQYHHTDALLANSSQGSRKVDADSIYRIGSISKLLTMYMFLVSDGDRHFNDPIAEHVPALLKAGPEWNTVTPEWNDITIGDLAGQMAGLARDFGLADLAPPKGQIGLLPASAQKLFPPLPKNEISQCGYLGADGTYPECTTEQYIQGVASESPIFSTAYTPVYSNEAFAIIGLALQELVGQEPEAIFNTTIVDALGLTDTTYTVPSVIPKNALIPANPLAAGWNTDLGVFGP